MGLKDRATLAVYIVYALQAGGQAISWQFISLFAKHSLGAPDFLTLTIIWSGPAFVTILFVNFWGAFSDRARARKPFMVVGFFGYSFTFFLYSFVTNSFQYLVVAMLGAVLSSSSLPVGQAHLTTNVENKGERLGYFLVVQSGGWFFGAFSSGFLYDVIGMFNLFRIAAVICITATGLAIAFVRDIPFKIEEKPMGLGFLSLLRKPGMMRLILIVALSQIGMNSISFLMSIMLVDELGGPAYYVGLANSAATLVAVLITGYVGRLVDRKGPVKILIAGTLCYVMFSFGFAVVTDPLAAAILWAFPIYPLSSTASFALAALLSGEEERGRAMSLVSGAQNTGSAAGPIVGGLFAQYIFGLVQPISWINMGFNLVALLIALSLLGITKTKENAP